MSAFVRRILNNIALTELNVDGIEDGSVERGAEVGIGVRALGSSGARKRSIVNIR